MSAHPRHACDRSSFRLTSAPGQHRAPRDPLPARLAFGGLALVLVVVAVLASHGRATASSQSAYYGLGHGAAIPTSAPAVARPSPLPAAQAVPRALRERRRDDRQAARRRAARRARRAAQRAAAAAASPPPSLPAASAVPAAVVPSGSAQQIAAGMLAAYGWGQDQMSCLIPLWNTESGWSVTAANPSGAYGIPQALPGSKMASAGADWMTDAATQIRWGLGYIQSTYGSPCAAEAHEASAGWY